MNIFHPKLKRSCKRIGKNISLHSSFKVFGLYDFVSIKSEREMKGVCTHNAETRACRTQAFLHERFDFGWSDSYDITLYSFECDLQQLLGKLTGQVLMTQTSVGLGGILLWGSKILIVNNSGGCRVEMKIPFNVFVEMRNFTTFRHLGWKIEKFNVKIIFVFAKIYKILQFLHQ